MHQTFYIDLEEEISSVIDRLNRSMSVDNYFVVPKRAIFLQSIVNLKLLKREADKVGKHVVIVTQDEVGASMAERSGLEIRSSVDGLETIVDAADEELVETYEQVPVVAVKSEQKKQIRLNGVGSSDFYASAAPSGGGSFQTAPVVKKQIRKNVASPASSATKRMDPMSGEVVRSNLGKTVGAKLPAHHRPQVSAGLGYEKNLNIEKEQALEKIYSTRENVFEKQSKPVIENDGRIKKIFISFIGLCALAFIGVALYLFVPSAKIIIEPNILKNKIDLDLRGSSDNVSNEEGSIPIGIIDKEVSVVLSYDVVGGAVAVGKKAHGSVVIYNEYDSSAQTLIATTRLEAANGKIFRLVKNVVVPGTTTVAGQVKPGAITAEVIADQPGSDYNLDPTTFSIPGFKDGPKYAKFYAKSTEPIVGGSSDGETAGGAVIQKDIDGAKQKTEAVLNEQIIDAIKAELKEDEVALAEAEKVTIAKSNANVKVGDMVTTFNYTAVATVRALVFAENDVRKNLEQLAGQQKSQDVKKEISKIEYGAVSADFDKNAMELKVYGEVTSTPIIDGQQIKSKLLGKTDEQLVSILKKYSSIKSVNIEFQPTFVTRIPQYSQRVTVEIKNEAN